MAEMDILLAQWFRAGCCQIRCEFALRDKCKGPLTSQEPLALALEEGAPLPGLEPGLAV